MLNVYAKHIQRHKHLSLMFMVRDHYFSYELVISTRGTVVETTDVK